MNSIKTPAEIVNELADMIIGLNESGLLHESALDEIDEVMGIIYAKENILFNQANKSAEFEDAEFCPTNPAYMIFEYVENKEQFSEDYKNVIDKILHSSGYVSDFDEVAEDIIKLRGL